MAQGQKWREKQIKGEKAIVWKQYMFFPFLTSEEVSHFPNQYFYFIFEKIDKVSFSMQFIASQTFVKSVTLILI